MTEPQFDKPELSPDPGGCTPGGVFLKEAILARWNVGTSFGGCYLHNGKTDGGTPSFHGVGRAVDIMIAADHVGVGEEIFQYLYDHRNEIGLNEVIFNSKIWWGENPSAGIHPYTVNRHVDHVHMSINIAASRQELAWYTGNPFFPPPPPPPTPEELRLLAALQKEGKTVYIPYEGQTHRFFKNEKTGQVGHAWDTGFENMSAAPYHFEAMDPGPDQPSVHLTPNNTICVSGMARGGTKLLEYRFHGGWVPEIFPHD